MLLQGFLRIAKVQKRHTIAEELTLLCAKGMNRTMIRKELKKKLNLISISDNIVQRRITMLSENIKYQVINEIKFAGAFSLQSDESTDV